MECGILVPQPGVEPTCPAEGAQSLHHWTSREIPKTVIFFFVVYKTEANHLANMDGHHFVTIYTLISVKYYFNHVN